MLYQEEHATGMGMIRNAYSILTGKFEVKRPIGRPQHRWKDTIRMDLRKQGKKLWTGFLWLRIRTSGGLFTVMKFGVP
jgi:hypothetical protein